MGPVVLSSSRKLTTKVKEFCLIMLLITEDVTILHSRGPIYCYHSLNVTPVDV